MKVSPRWRRRLLRTGLVSLAVLVVLAVVAGLAGVWAVRRPFPTHAGELALPGLSAPVTVYRDGYGIPQIYAETAEDLFRAQGYVHAQDRFWEMDFRRHVTSGRTAELFGDGQVETDAFLRTLGWRRVAEAEWNLLTPQTRAYLTAYAEGVNAWIEATGGPEDTGRKALQYRVLGLRNSGYEVAPWDPVDSLAWLKAMAWDLRTNLEDETDRAVLLTGGLTRDQVEQLYPPYPFQQHDPIVDGGEVAGDAFDPAAEPGGAGGALTETLTERLAGSGPVLADLRARAAALPRLLGTAAAGLGSNSWVVSGELTETGAPLLVNDPHLGVSLPGIWYQAGLHCGCGYQASGFTFSGVPGVIIGHNGQIAWGFTNLGHDVTDLYLERLDGDRYQVDGQWRELTLREETIRVAGGEDVTLTVRHTHRGPLLSDVSDQLAALGGDEAVRRELGDGAPGTLGVSLAWTALEPGTTIEALFALNQAQDWEEFRAAAARFEVPAQNLVYADRDGTIGYQAPGRVPVREQGDGRYPVPGWDSGYDWQGYLPFEQLPYLLNPDSGRIVTANQAVTGPQYQPWLSQDWSYGFRAARIHALLDQAASPLTVSDMETMVADSAHTFAPLLVPHLLAAPDTGGPDTSAARDLLAGWDFRQPADPAEGTSDAASAAAAAYFNATWRHLLELLFDELPTDAPADGGDRWFVVVGSLLGELGSQWWDRVGTPAAETRDEILGRALAGAYQELADAQGDDPAQWRWGRMHTLHLRDPTFGSSGVGPIEALFNRGPYPTAGGRDAVNATSWSASEGYQVVAGPSMRMVADLSDLDESRWIQGTGNSGHAYHRNYTDQVDPWLAGALLPWRWERTSIEAEARDVLTLTPR